MFTQPPVPRGVSRVQIIKNTIFINLLAFYQHMWPNFPPVKCGIMLGNLKETLKTKIYLLLKQFHILNDPCFGCYSLLDI